MFRYFLSGSGDIKSYIISLLLTLPVSLIALTFHEYAHGWVALKCGDHTADNLGRLTLNPLKHLDPIGFLCMIVCGFGWAKPVPINSRNFNNPKRGMALTALAGPVANLLLGFVSAFLMELTFFIAGKAGIDELSTAYTYIEVTGYFFYYGCILNVYLAVFNLIPVPPFDGSRIAFIFLPSRWYFGIMKYERYIMIGLMILLWTGALTTPLSYIAGLISNGMFTLLELIPIF